MKKSISFFQIFGPITILVISLFCPYIYTENGISTVFFTDFNVNYPLFYVLSWIGIAGIFAASILIKQKTIYPLICSGAAFICFILSLYFYSSVKAYAGFYFVLLCSLALVGISYYGFIEKFEFSISDIVETAMFIGLAMVLDLPFLKFKIGANGGSISLVMVPLLILSLRKGFAKGFIACGIVYGIINFVMDEYSPLTLPLDYFLAFGSLAIIGLFKKQILNNKNRLTIRGVIFLISSIAISLVFRIFFHTLSGMFNYGLNFVGSLVYQLLYLIPSAIVCIIAMLILYKPLLSIEKRFSKR